MLKKISKMKIFDGKFSEFLWQRWLLKNPLNKGILDFIMKKTYYRKRLILKTLNIDSWMYGMFIHWLSKAENFKEVHMKRILLLAMLSVMMFSVTACGGGNKPAAEQKNTNQAKTEQTKESKGLTDEERAKEFITVATGPTSGIYYPIGGAFATALKDYGYDTSAEATNATGANIQLMLDGDAEIAIAMQDAVMQAYQGTQAYKDKEPAKDLRAMMRLWPNYVQLVTTSDTGIKSVKDLVGKRVGVGAPNSGVEINARMILESYGITYDDITPDYLAYGEAIENMKNKQCDAVFVTSGLPNATVMELGVQYDMVVVPIDGEGRDKLVEEYPYYAKTVIPADTYNNKEDIEGVFVYNIMLVRGDLPDNVVYDMLEGIFKNISTIKSSHNAADKNIDITFGVDDVQLPLHPGAEQFWKDQGYIK